MSENQYDGLNDNDWDDSWEFAWSEFDWERHLREQDKTITAYLASYERAIDRPDRIDDVAHVMGWDRDDWMTDEADAPEGSGDEPKAGDRDAPEAPEAMDPYTIQKHPVYVATRSLFFWLQRGWEFIAPACGPRLPMRTALAFSHVLSRAEHDSLLATQALDMGDFSLSVCLLKRAMQSLNTAFHHLQSLDEGLHPAFAQFRRQAGIRMFDIREIWLRVMRDCRQEINRRVGESDN